MTTVVNPDHPLPSTPGLRRRRLLVSGVVQGVGFRPFVARLARELGLTGGCRNEAAGVTIDVCGTPRALEAFERRLRTDAPPLASITAVTGSDLDGEPAGCEQAGASAGFRIQSSGGDGPERTLIPPDTATCEECLSELRDPTDRRYRHPFITCTNCGPRLSIITGLPYDRPATTMAAFAMCPTCAQEYRDVHDRRYHAQPVACHECGPRLSFRAVDSAASDSAASDSAASDSAAGDSAMAEPALSAAVEVLATGGILAIKGIGGYHLACLAGDDAAVARLRRRKNRPDQPFALLVADLAAAATVVRLPDGADPLLASPQRPIVLLPTRTPTPGAAATGPARSAPGPSISAAVAPGLHELGVMLAHNPVQHLLLADLAERLGTPPVLVMTSGNLSGEPLCYTTADAHARLGSIADAFLDHDREIAVPVEDSVLAWHDGEAVPVRRSRGFAPLPVALPGPHCVLAAGAEVKNTATLTRQGLAFVSAHVGDLATLESRTAYRRTVDQLLRFHRQTPELVVVDAHPGYASRAWAEQIAARFAAPVHEVQHHHAHLAALAAEHHRLDRPLLGLVYDGTGYGCDRTVWGGELLLLDDHGRTARRLGHLGTVRLPGGDAGVRNPVRTAALALTAAGAALTRPVSEALTDAEAALLSSLLVAQSAWVETSSVGRLFDVVASMLGVRHRVSYEAQAAIELEVLATRWHARDPKARPLPLDLPVLDGTVLDVDALLRDLAECHQAGHSAGYLAWSFHQALAKASIELLEPHVRALNLSEVGLTGGVFGNRLLTDAVVGRLGAMGLTALTHRVVPPNDGGLSLGQAAVGSAHLAGLTRHGCEGD